MKSKLSELCIGVFFFLLSDCERGFSTLKRVKTPLRNRLCKGTLQNLLMISTEGEETLDFDYSKAVNKWTAMKKRRLSVK